MKVQSRIQDEAVQKSQPAGAQRKSKKDGAWIWGPKGKHTADICIYSVISFVHSG